MSGRNADRIWYLPSAFPKLVAMSIYVSAKICTFSKCLKLQVRRVCCPSGTPGKGWKGWSLRWYGHRKSHRLPSRKRRLGPRSRRYAGASLCHHRDLWTTTCTREGRKEGRRQDSLSRVIYLCILLSYNILAPLPYFLTFFFTLLYFLAILHSVSYFLVMY